MKRAHKGGTWKYACACRSGVRYEGESEAWDQLKTMIKERGAAAEDVTMKRAHKGGTWKYACACRSGVRYEGESEAWDQLKTMIKERGAAAEDVRDVSEGRGIDCRVEDASENDPFASKDTVPVPPEDRAPGELRGAGARSPLFWKLMLVAMALIWGYSFLTMKTVLDTVPTFTLLACRFLLSAVIMFIIFTRSSP